MDDFNKDPVGFLQHKLQTTVTLKKNIWRLALNMFTHMKKETSGLVNAENHFMVEGTRGLHYLFDGIDHTEATCENLSLLVKKTMAVAIDSDLFGPDFKQIQYITLGQIFAKNKEIGHGQKIGFQMKNDADIEG